MMMNSAFFPVKFFRLAAVAALGLACGLVAIPAFSQANVLTQHNSNMRSGLNAQETILTPNNVNTATFGVIGSRTVDGKISAQPLYVANVNIPGQGVHNVAYVVTLHDSVYAFDAGTGPGVSANPLWQVSFLNPAAGITTEPPVELGCISTTANTEMGILGTPVIDANSATMYVVAKTKENGSYHFHLHALDLSTGFEKFGGPIDLSGSVVGKAGTLALLQAGKNMMARPGMLLSQGIVYMAFGSNGCDGGGTRGWVLAYDATTLLQLGIFNTAPDSTIAHGNIWQAGGGLASDDQGNIFFSTANGPFDANLGSNDFGSSIMKISWGPNGLSETDYFTPYNQAALSNQDLDVGSAGVTILPDQPGPHPHLIVGSGKSGDVYVMDRDNMGKYNPVDNNQIVQYLPTGVGRMFSTAAYWNGNVYFTGQVQGVSQFSLSGSQLALVGRNSNALCCPHTPSISANQNTNGILWIPNGGAFVAYNASDVTLPALYTNSKLGTLAHFNTPTIANGRVYVGTDLSLQILGLLGNLKATSGDGQTGPALGTLPAPLTVTATDAYTGAPVAGITITFSDGSKGGVFNPATAVTNAAGKASTSYTVPKLAGLYTITASNPATQTAKFAVTVVGGTATHIVVVSGNKQVGALQSAFSLPLVVKLADVSSNGVSGGTVTFSVPANSGTFAPVSVVTDSKGLAQTFYTSGTKSGAIAITVTSGSFRQGMSETVQPGPATKMTIVSGNSQKAAAGTTLPATLVAKVVDQFGNEIPGLSVTFSDGGVGGTVSVVPVTTDSLGRAIVSYTLPSTPQVVHITATMSGLALVTFTVTAQ